MGTFRDPEVTERARARIEQLTGLELGPFFAEGFAGNPSPETALSNLERWLRATSSPGLHMQQIAALPPLGKLLMDLLGASQPVADTLIQNPELASLVLEPGAVGSVPTRERLLSEGHKLLAASNSYLHSLDRLRFLRQRWNLQIVVNDIAGSWPQPKVWNALSVVADALIELAAFAAWNESRSESSPANCPVMIVAFGKLAGSELNYSSDVDLVYVAPDGLDERSSREVTKFCGYLTRALSDRMGRGSLFRVDLRLRPYGGSGPVIQSATAVETYYQLYAEPWEIQALIRSRPIAGPADLQSRWITMREQKCFRPKLSEMALEQLIDMRSRIETGADDGDLKRGAGGIRDVEFLTQIFQLLHGFEHDDLQAIPTIDTILALEGHGILEHADAASFVEGYAFLRRLEHRTQLLGDQQTHSIPDSEDARSSLARLMGLASWADLERALTSRRRTISTLYRSILNLELPSQENRTIIRSSLGHQGPAALQWFDSLHESKAFYSALLANEGSLERVRSVLLKAPRLVAFFKDSLSLTELLVSGEIDELSDFAGRLDAVPLDAPPKVVADVYRTAYVAAVAQEVLSGFESLNQTLSLLADSLIRHCCRRLLVGFDVIALGSLGTGDFGPGSDADVLLLANHHQIQQEAEIQAQFLLSFVSELRRLGAPFEMDLRLRPDGGKGMLVRSYAGLKAYDFDGMEMWERFALGHARQLSGEPESLDIVLHSAYGLPLTPERLKELLRMKRRIETERVQPQHVKRDVKLGYGGLSDIEWLVHLHEMRYPTAMETTTVADMRSRIRRLSRAGLMNTLEVEVLGAAHSHLWELRSRLYLMGAAHDLLPENPDKLDRLAQVTGHADGNHFLAHHEQIIESVRRLYTESLERLKA